MKPRWDNAPEWANYLAKDEGGFWYWYENEPKINNSTFSWTVSGGRFFPADEEEIYWRDSLETRP